ncbi:hypothetical protein PTKIN_Ptkin11bG0157300 [Pterospermum kingtungense]
MASNKDLIEKLDAEISRIHDSLSRFELGVADKLQRLEETIGKLSDAMYFNQNTATSSSPEQISFKKHDYGSKETNRALRKRHDPRFPPSLLS